MQEVLQGINLNIKAGERICITGPGGSGKTTLTNILAGFNLGFEGIVTINNYSIRDLDLTGKRARQVDKHHRRARVQPQLVHNRRLDLTPIRHVQIL